MLHSKTFSLKRNPDHELLPFDEFAAVGAQQGPRWEESALLKVQVVLSSHHVMSSGATVRAGVGMGLASVGR